MDINYERILVYVVQLSNRVDKYVFISDPITTMVYVLHKARQKGKIFVTVFA